MAPESILCDINTNQWILNFYRYDQGKKTFYISSNNDRFSLLKKLAGCEFVEKKEDEHTLHAVYRHPTTKKLGTFAFHKVASRKALLR